MGRYIARRLLATVLVLLLVTLISFSIMHMVPGDPAVVMAGIGASADQVQRIREQFGLDAPFLVRLGRWYGGLLHGDLGNSILLGRTVARAIAERLPVTLSLAALAFVLTAAFGLTLGTTAAVKQNTWIDQTVMALAVIGVSVPSFWLGLILIIVFSVMVDWLPAGGYVPFGQDPGAWFRALVLPAASLALLQVGLLARITRATILETLRQDFVRTARAKGLPGWLVVGKHAFTNVMIPVMTVLGISVSLLLSGSVVVETVFSVPGLGRLMATAILARDYPVIQGGLLVTALMFVVINLVVDVLYAWLDPRIHYD
ncbi:MAG: ABC transporter permease [Candidatus Rokubacteria bacterium]|nr:ABC transporter permease [Candidatus Rokubacteria bacterium]